MKKLLIILIVLSLMLTSCTKKSESNLDHLGRIKESGVITVAMEGTWAPWTYHDEKDVLTGYDVDVASAIAQKLGVKASFVEGEWDGLFAGLDAGRYDIVVNGVDITEERSQKYNFSTPYAYNKTAIIVNQDRTDINSFYELLDVRDSVNKVIMFYEITKHQKAIFYLVDGNELYIYTLKAVDVEKQR